MKPLARAGLLKIVDVCGSRLLRYAKVAAKVYTACLPMFDAIFYQHLSLTLGIEKTDKYCK